MHRILAIGVFAMCSIGQMPRDVVKLRSPRTTGGTPLNDALALRRSVREFAATPLTWREIEIGHAAQNLLLEAVALGPGAVPAGAFSAEDLHRVLGLPADHVMLYLAPVGHPA